MFKSRKSKITVIIVAVLLVAAISLFVFKSYTDQPQDLGPELEYIGKRHTGCPLPLPLGYILLCSSEPGEEYYFGTDMSVEELRSYFGKAKPTDAKGGGTFEEFDYIYIQFENSNPTNFFYINYFDNPEAVRQTYHLDPSIKANILSISKEDYLNAKNAL